MSNTSNSKNRNNNQSSNDEWIAELAWALAKAAGHLLWWTILFPALSVPVIVAIWIGVGHGPPAGLLTTALAVAGYTAWACVQPSSFTQWVVDPVRQRWLSWLRYRRNWQAICALHGLTAKLGQRTLVPALQSVRIGAHTDVLDVRVVSGQSVNDWQKQAAALAAAWRADRLTIRATAPGELRVVIMRGDVLADPVRLPMPTAATPVDLAAVQVGVTESLVVDAGAGASHPGGRCHGLGEGIGAVVADRRRGARSQVGAGALVRDRPERRHGTRRRHADVFAVLHRRVDGHRGDAAPAGGVDAGAGSPAARTHPTAYPQRRRPVDRGGHR
jgi:hypothetical protein